jgi:hypothetical protein
MGFNNDRSAQTSRRTGTHDTPGEIVGSRKTSIGSGKHLRNSNVNIHNLGTHRVAKDSIVQIRTNFGTNAWCIVHYKK